MRIIDTLPEILEYLRKIFNKVNHKNKLILKSMKDTDVRAVFLRNIGRALDYCHSQLSIYKNTYDNFYPLMLMGFTPNIEHLKKEFFPNLEIFPRILLTTFVHFQVENLLETIFSHFSNTQFGSMKQILDEGEKKGFISNGDKDNFLLLTSIRNSLHNNGIHNHPDNDNYVNIHADFQFKKGGEVLCAGWGHVLFLIDKIIDAVLNIFLDQRISTFNYIPDRFADKKASISAVLP